MIQAKKVAKRGLSWLLTLAMLLSVVNITVFASGGEPETVSKSSLVISQFGSELTEKEQEIVKLLITGDYRYVEPNGQDDQNDPALIEIDDGATTKTITAHNYTDSEGNVWKPVSASVSVDGETEPRELALDASGQGSFELTELKAYSVTVRFRFSDDISAETDALTTALQAPAKVAQGLKTMKFMKNYVAGNLESLAEKVPDLTDLCVNGYDRDFGGVTAHFTISDEQFKGAVAALQAQIDAYNGHMKLAMLLANGQADEDGNPVADISLANLMANGATINAGNTETLAIIEQILTSDAWTTLTSADVLNSVGEDTKRMINVANDALTALKTNMTTIQSTDWTLDDATLTQLGALTDEQLAAVEAAALEITDPDTSRVFTVGGTLKVAEKLVTRSVGQTTVVIKINAKVIDAENNLVDADPEVPAGEITLLKNTPKADIQAAIEATGIETDALHQWEEKYQVNKTNYTRTASELPETLGDATVTYTVTYEPKEFTWTIVDEGGNDVDSATVKYGTTITLPSYEGTEAKVYDYDIEGESYFQGQTYRITKNVTITQSLGDAYAIFQIDELTARARNTQTVLDDNARTILNNPAVVTREVKLREPSAANKLVTAKISGGVYTVNAKNYNSSLAGNWKPDTATVYNAAGTAIETKDFAGANSVVLASVDFDRVVVTYVLTVPDARVGNKIGPTVNLPAELKQQADKLKEGLGLLTATAVMNDMSKLDKESLEQLRTGVTTYEERLGADVVNGVINVLDNCVAPNKSLKLYNYLNSYSEDGLSYYYTNATIINEQINLLTTNLSPILAKEAVFKEVLTDVFDAARAEEYWDRITNVLGAFDDANAILQDPAYAINDDGPIDRTSPSLKDLTDALDNDVTVGAAPSELVLTKDVPAEVEGKCTLTLVVQKANSKGQVLSSMEQTFTYGEGDAVITADVEAAIASLRTGLGYDDVLYVTGDYTIPATLTANTELTVTFSPKAFSVTLVENGTESELTKVYIDNLTVTLPENPTEGMRWDYYVNGATVPVSGDTYSFTEADLRNNTLRIERKTVNVGREDLTTLVDELNKDIINGGMTAAIGGGNNTGVATFILHEDASGKQTLIMRITPSSNIKRTEVFASIMETVSGSGLYVEIEGQPFWSNSKLYPQAAIDMLLNSGFGMQRMIDLIDENGDIKELDLNAPAGTHAFTDTQLTSSRSGESVNAVVNLHPVYEDDVNGGTLIQTTLKIGVSATATEDVDLYITLEDFDVRASTLKTLRSNLKKLAPYFDLTLADDSFRLTVKDGPAYKAYLTAAVAAGYTNINDIYNMDDQEFIEFLFSFVETLVNQEDITLSTYQNTVAELGVDVDVSEYDSYFEYLRKAAKELINNSTLNTKTGTFWKFDYSIEELVEKAILKAGASTDLKNIIADMNVTYAVSVVLPDKEYCAVVICPDAGNRNKINYPGNGAELQTVLNENNKDVVVILLTDVPETIEFNKNVAFDLNGKTLGGIKVNASANNVVIVDSTLDNSGKVTGSVTGTDALKITGGTFDADVTAYLPDGYVQNGGKVTNKLYELSLEGDNVIVNIDADRITLYGFPSVKALAVELAFDLAMNYYSAAALTVAGNELYDAHITDISEWLVKITEDDVNEILNCLKMDGINAFIDQVITDLTDLPTLAGNVDGDLASYDYSFNTWTLEVHKSDSEDELDADLVANTNNTKEGTIIFRFKEGGDYSLTGFGGSKEEVKALLEKLAEVTTINEVSLELEQPTYASRTLKLKGTGKGDVEFDLRDDPNYAIALGVILANGAEDANKTAIVDAIKTYYETGALAPLKAAFEATSNTEALAGFAKYNRAGGEDIFKTFVENVGLTDTVNDEEILKLARTWRAFLVTIGTAIEKSGVTGGGAELGTYETGEYGVYSLEKSRTVTRSKDIRRWTVEGTAVGESGKLTIKLFREDVLVEVFDENGNSVAQYFYGDAEALSKAFDDVQIGYTIKVYDDVTLDKDVEVADGVEITIEGAGFIDFDGKTITLNETSKVTVLEQQLDKDVNFKSFSDRFVVKEEQSGENYIYSLAANVLVEVLNENGNSVAVYYFGDDEALNKAFDDAQADYTIKVYGEVKLTEDKEIPADTNINLETENDEEFVTIEATITLNKGATLTSNVQLPLDKFASATSYSEPAERDSYVYYLKPLDPEIVSVSVTTGDVIKAAKVDNDEKLIYIDLVNYSDLAGKIYVGFISPDDLSAALIPNIVTNNADTVEARIEGSSTDYTGEEVVPTGAKLIITATNPDSDVTATATYYIIHLGDTNCNGYIESGDAQLMMKHFLGQGLLESYALLAADVNQNKGTDYPDGVDSGDAWKNQKKFVDNENYTSSLT
ncbi:MAG: hypothetical protein K6G17_05555 [Oscillospiraceae bacterium]|nr:hypothetical protein [Oscillospiraceae bacterium]